MSVSIRLSRIGAKKNAYYRVVVATTRSKRDGENIEILGNYNPKFKKLELDSTKFDEWVKKGAIVTTGVKRIIDSNK